MAALSTSTYGKPELQQALIRIPSGTMVDGAVIELAHHDDDTITGEIRIPGPAVA
jgi:hypothetical protein